MGIGTILTILMPLITHIVDHLLAKDTSKLSVAELEDHNKDLECANGFCALVGKLKE